MAEEVLQVKKGNPPRDIIRAYRGNTFVSDVYRITDAADNPVDISGYTFEFEVRKNEYQNTGPALIAAEAGDFILGQSDAAIAAGIAKDEVVIKIPKTRMNVSSGDWICDFRTTDGSGDREAGFKAKFLLQEDVSNLSP